ncbi:MAG: amidophosphoribosyltransferase [Planctomycetota bacterium]|nr:amidophosphoribosyltransferase [Planctomycetota bacterium]
MFGAFGVPDAALRTCLGLFALQHRGQESAGIVASDGNKVQSKKGMGLVTEVFDARAVADELPGHIAVGHVRYSTSGSNRPVNIQPLIANYSRGLVAVAHNGNLVNARRLRRELEAAGSIFQTSTDSEVIIHLLARPENAVAEYLGLCRVARIIRGAFSLVVMTRTSLMALRDPWGFRPLCTGRIGEGYAIASETCAFDHAGASFEREVEPGELVIVDSGGIRSVRCFAPEEICPAHCVFEHVYFARPDSVVFGDSVQEVRLRLGRELAKERPAAADVVIPVPDSGNEAALGFSRASGIPFEMGLIRSHYVGRSFIQPGQKVRETAAALKLNAVRSAVAGRRVVVVDDSLVRGTTFRKTAAKLREAGAREVHVRISCPPHRFPCFYGIDFPTRTELLAYGRTEEEICRFLGVDSIGYLSVEGMLSCVSRPSGHYCTACWTGRYPVEPEDNMGDKLGMETGSAIDLSDPERETGPAVMARPGGGKP